MSTIRKLTVKLDRDGKPFVKYKHFDNHFIVRPGVPDCFGGDGAEFKKGDKVHVSIWNQNMGYFMIKLVGNPGDKCIWQGPRYDLDSREWVGEQIKG